MKVKEIIKRKKPGDLTLVAKILGIHAANARVALRRPGSKYHEKVVEILGNLIRYRDSLAI